MNHRDDRDSLCFSFTGFSDAFEEFNLLADFRLRLGGLSSIISAAALKDSLFIGDRLTGFLLTDFFIYLVRLIFHSLDLCSSLLLSELLSEI
jgi:hypothetical protein